VKSTIVRHSALSVRRVSCTSVAIQKRSLATQSEQTTPPSSSSSSTSNTNLNLSSSFSGGTLYGGRYTVTLIPGDGIGREMTDAVRAVFKAAHVPIDWETIHLQADEKGHVHIEHALDSLRRNKLGLKGVLFTPIIKTGFQSFNLQIRKELDLFANVIVCKSLPGYPTRHKNVDICIIRENTEGEYSGLEHEVYPGVVESMKVITKASSDRIAKFAFDFARMNGRHKVTAVHKANIMKLGDGLFLKSCEKTAELYRNIQFENMIVDNCAMQLVAKPNQFDVMVMPNLYGNIVSNIGAGLIGGPGVAPGANIGSEIALFEPGARHVALDIQGRNLANPTAMIMSATMMLRHMGLHSHANIIEGAVINVIREGKVRTTDMGGSSTTTDFTLAVIADLM